jgi:bifunctional non-homologous end joining protein LigD
MALREYHKKRDFVRTPEPAGITKQKKKKQEKRETGNLRFVVQRHEATRLHYDFRLETKEGTLKSWAVPKGIALDPKVKRLAVMTEDHPLGYLLFEGVIPEGNYGAGTVIVWDTGSYTTEQELSNQLQSGKITVTLFGQKLKGKYLLVKPKREDNQWLLIKVNDQYASAEELTMTRPESVLTKRTNVDLNTKKLKESDCNRQKQKRRELEKEIDLRTTVGEQKEQKILTYHAEFPTFVKPMLGTLVNKPFDNRDWVFEVKWDGVRAILFLDKGEHNIELKSRNNKSITHRYPELVSPLESAVNCKESVILDGEIVVLNKKGFPDFQEHQRRMNVDHLKEIEMISRQIPATYYFFDILYNDGKNVQRFPFVDRRKILSDIIRPNDRIRISDYVEENGIEVFEKIKSMNLEGIMAKKRLGIYMQSTRSTDWLKIKNIQTQDCIVIGYTKGEGNRQGYFGSLLLAMYDDELGAGGELRFVGHTGSGFDFSLLESIYKRLEKMKVNACPIKYVPYTNREPVWVRPELVVEVKFHGWTKDRIMRAPIFLRLREDKSPIECRIESEKKLKQVISADISTSTITNTSDAHKKSSKARNVRKVGPSSKIGQSINLQSFSHLDKTFWNKTSDHRELTKKDLIDYYESMSDYILPYLKDRPVSLSRYPDGVTGKHFYHKNWDKNKPEFVETVKVYSESRDHIINYVVCNNKETLFWLANLGCIEMHPWFSTVKDLNSCKARKLDEEKSGLNYPDFIVFDLDPYIYSGEEDKGQEPEYNINGFKVAVQLAYHLKGLLDNLNIRSYVKTSGKTGLHIFVSIVPSYTYHQTRKFAEVIGRMLVKKYPTKITMDWDTTKRQGKVFFDHNQNAKGKTIASIFSARPTLSASVSMPIWWKQLSSITPPDFSILNVPEVVKKVGDPWKNILQEKQDINKILENVKEF